MSKTTKGKRHSVFSTPFSIIGVDKNSYSAKSGSELHRESYCGGVGVGGITPSDGSLPRRIWQI